MKAGDILDPLTVAHVLSDLSTVLYTIMCGIYCSISTSKPSKPSAGIEELLRQRGPDYYDHEQIELDVGNDDGTLRTIYITLAASVLALRKERDDIPVPQPFALPDNRGFLCWNGELWRYDGNAITGSDTKFIAERLADIDEDSPHAHSRTLDVLGWIRGPYSFIYFNFARQMLYFGRDCVGRRSLVTTRVEDGGFVLSSAADLEMGVEWEEVDADGIYHVDLNKIAAAVNVASATTKVPWSTNRTNGEMCFHLPWGPLNMTSPSPGEPHERLHTGSKAVDSLLYRLQPSVELRLPERHRPDHPPIAILFSGGLDCTLLARIIHEVIHTNAQIDLLNVAFENPRIHKNIEGDVYETCPDRITARSSLVELRNTCPGRHWNLVCVNVPYTETLEHRQQVRDLIHPHDTEMDVSIAMALYFAARGPTTSKVLFSGLGADELFGGYQRHALAYKRGGYQGLLEELLLDTERLGKRNLGRDDRAISRWAREARYPFLDEDVIAWAMEAPIEHKLGFSFVAEDANDHARVELDDKLVLRCIAKKLGMDRVAKEAKRAIQFGSRSAKMESGRSKGTDKMS